MHIRPLHADDHSATLDLLIDTFAPFFEDYVRPHLGEQVFQHQHGHWQQDYRDELPTLHAPDEGRYASIGILQGGAIGGLVSWRVDARSRHGEIYLLAVAPASRRQRIGRTLCEHAIAHMRSEAVEVLQIGTGGDPFHAPARALYQQLGLTETPVAVYLGAI